MKKSVLFLVLFTWVLLEPPNDKNGNPIKGAPLKTWKIPSFGSKGTAPAYFDTKKDCEAHRATMWFGQEKVCFPVDELKNR